MEIQKNYSCLEHNGKFFTKQIELENDYQEALPAYCDDVYRVVKCCGRSCITSLEINLNEIKIFGKTDIGLTYYNENSSLCYADFEEDFVKTVNVEGLSDSAFVNADIFDKYTNFRVINQRRIDVHSSCLINLTVYDRIKCPTISSCNNSKLKTEDVRTADVFNTYKTKLEFDEDFSLNSGSEPIKRIVFFSGFATLSEIKLIKDKALIKALVSVRVLYTADNEEESLEAAEYSFNISKIIDSPGITDNDIAITNLSIGSLYVKAKSNSGEQINNFDVFGDVIADILFIKESDSTLIKDGYIPHYQSECNYNDFSYNEAGKYISENNTSNLSFRIPDDISKVYDVSISIGNSSVTNGNLKFHVQINVVFKNSGGELGSFSGDNELSFDINGYNEAIAALNINSFDYTLSGSNTLELRLNATINAYLYNSKTTSVLSDISANEGLEDSPAITVYFGKANDDLWDIAKAFSSDSEKIKTENDLQSDTLATDRVLIIPKA